MKKKLVVILTEDRYENPKATDWYTNNVLKEDFLLGHELSKLGFLVKRASWSSKSFNWSIVDFAVFRTTWDYFERLEEFLSWIKEHQNKINFINPASQILWNLNKIYLQKLKLSGIPIVPSFFLKKNTKKTLHSVFQETSWNELIIKPAVSAAAWNTHRVSKNNLKKKESVFFKLKSTQNMIVQEFQKSVLSFGEISFIVILGKVTHAVLKRAKTGDYRVQDDYGGTVKLYTPNNNEILFVENVIKKCPKLPIYARVDVLLDNNKNLVLSELELIEPELWFRLHKKSATILAKIIFNFIENN